MLSVRYDRLLCGVQRRRRRRKTIRHTVESRVLCLSVRSVGRQTERPAIRTLRWLWCRHRCQQVESAIAVGHIVRPWHRPVVRPRQSRQNRCLQLECQGRVFKQRARLVQSVERIDTRTGTESDGWVHRAQERGREKRVSTTDLGDLVAENSADSGKLQHSRESIRQLSESRSGQ